MSRSIRSLFTGPGVAAQLGTRECPPGQREALLSVNTRFGRIVAVVDPAAYTTDPHSSTQCVSVL